MESAASNKSSEAASRIRALNDIDKDVPATLELAGHAIALLTTEPPESLHVQSTQSRKDAFTEASKAYYSNLKSIRNRLLAEVDALEQAGLIKPDRSSETVEEGVTNGGLGNFDIGWLNARTRDVGVAKEAELLKEARELLEKMTREQSEPGNKKDEDVVMVGGNG